MGLDAGSDSMTTVTTRALLEWYAANARRLPWRSEPRDPYEVIVSEFMLQQTQVERVVGYFGVFVSRFPDLEVLAAASEEEVLASWSGLGYYRRARMLHRLAKEVAAGSGELPRSAAELERLPGIGHYTAAAVASLAFGEVIPVLDGNVMRVGARVLAMDADPRAAEGHHRLLTWVLGLMEGAPPGEINEALMELGATVCTATDPGCAACPLATECRAKNEGRPEVYPPPRRRRASIALRWVAACCVDDDGQWLLRRIDEGPVLRGLWLPPLAELATDDDPCREAARLVPEMQLKSGEVVPAVRHTITHRRLSVIPVRFAAKSFAPPSNGWRWVDPRDPKVPTSSLLAKLVGRCDDLEDCSG